MPNVTVLLFGATADLVGRRSVELPLAEAATSEHVLQLLKNHFPALDSQKLLISVNREYASAGREIQRSDEVAVFTPVSGG